ncbi:MAG: Hpt domain-containing protein [Christensenellaceae bacterium]|jgi:HPt (histidine-containing phosphotransfer) domain-containing protein|nr:Hpt domain-containing protein [Christensenellaceae bacterium]
MSYIDLKTAMTRLGNNLTLYKRLLKMFLDNSKFSELEDALASDDLHMAADVAHAIKGVAGNLALEPLFALSTDLMNQLRMGLRDADTITAYRETLNLTKAEVQEFLNS